MKEINYDTAIDFAEFSLEHLDKTKQPLQYQMTADAFIGKLTATPP